MLRTFVYAKFCKHLSSETVLGKHALNRFVNGKVGLLSHHSGIRNLLQSADITRVISVKFLFEFLTRKNYFIAVHNDNEIAAINVRSERRLVFSAKNGSNLRRKSTKRNSLGIDDIPFSFYRLAFCHISFHLKNLQIIFLYRKKTFRRG